ncbi:MAG TPA: phenylalanine--tRNA ligase subunit alpha [Candidatus Saccharimonadales bacterium]|jgi:phenylalanyl-tRNA synthetase alpha chain
MIHEPEAKNVVILMLKMGYTLSDVAQLADDLKKRQSKLPNPMTILRDPTLKKLVASIKDQPPSERAEFGRTVNELKIELTEQARFKEQRLDDKPPIDVSAPFDTGVSAANQPKLLPASEGSLHPVMQELGVMEDIFVRMGFRVERSRLIDDDYHMFESLNFPASHPARDDYDTFMTSEGLILPAHTSTMQHRVLKAQRAGLAHGQPIAAVIPGRVFRNEDLDATHEHTFHQVEGIYVDSGISLGDMMGTIQTFLEAYFNEPIEFKTQPFYFPFVEPGLEFLIKMPTSWQKPGSSQWLEIMGCGMIHPNVLKEAGVNPSKYSGFAWGMGVERLIMLKHGIEDIRYFMSGRLDFLKMFKGEV